MINPGERYIVKQIGLIVAIVLATALAACSKQEPTAADALPESMASAPESGGGNVVAEQAALQIEDAYMRAIVVEISDDRYVGRGPGSRGD